MILKKKNIFVFLLFLSSTVFYFCDDILNLISEGSLFAQNNSIILSDVKYRSGDYLDFCFSAERKGYFLVYHIDSEGKESCLFPLGEKNGNYIFQHQKLQLPRYNKFRLNARKSGKEYLICLHGIESKSDSIDIKKELDNKGLIELATIKKLYETISIVCTEYCYEFVPLENTYVLSVGISRYKHLNNLKSPEKDAEDFSSVMKDHYFVPPENMFTLTNTAATKQNIVKFLDKFSAINNEQKDIIFYFSGHGKKIKDLNGDEDDNFDESICPYDFSETEAETYLIDDEIFRYINLLKENSRRVTFIFDTCYSGDAFKTFAVNLFDADEFYSNEKENMEGFCFFASSKAGETSSDVYDELENSLFTHYLLSAFKGQAELNGDGVLDSDEIYEFINNEMGTYSANKKFYFQTPVRYPDDRLVIMGETK